MEIIDNLNSRFRIDANESSASIKDIDSLIKFSNIPVPDDYLKIVKKMTEVEILIDGNKYIRIWGPDGCIEMNVEYEIQSYIPHSLAIGDNEGGMALVLMEGSSGFGLYKVGFGDLDRADAIYIASSLSEFLIQGTGSNLI